MRLKLFIFLILFVSFSPVYSVTVAEETLRLNQDLEKYHKDLETKAWDNGKLYYNIGNVFFQLQEYPWAILYYEKALLQRPHDRHVRENLKRAQAELLIDKPPSPFKNFFSYFPLQQSLFLFGILCLLTLLLASFYIWFPSRLLRYSFFLTTALGSLILLNCLYLLYFSPLEGILVNASMLYRGAGKQYSIVKNFPVLTGTKVHVLDVVDNGRWIKILTPEGTIGYVSHETVRLI